MLAIDVVTIFPRMFEGPLAEGIVRRAIDRGLARVAVHDLRDFTMDRHRAVDDVPYGGGPGMVLKPEPLFRAVEALRPAAGSGALPAGEARAAVALLTPQGARFDQATAVRLSRLEHLILLCGRYEGVDARVHTFTTEELSIGDYVLTGGEIPALVVIDAVVRLLPGAVGDAASVGEDSFSRGLLDHPQYTRPAAFRGETVPEVLVSGHHADIRRWRKREALRRTMTRRPDLLGRASLDDEERAILADLVRERQS